MPVPSQGKPLQSDNSFLQKALDIFATPQRVVLGTLEALGSSGDIGESIKNAIATRRSFSDIFRENGVEPTTAGVLGLGADIFTDPINLIPGVAIGKAVGGGARLLGPIAAGARRTAGVLPRLVSEVAAETPTFRGAAVAGELRAVGARRAFRAAVPAGETRESVGEVVWQRALADAKRDAFKAGASTAVGDPVVQGSLARRMLDQAGRAVTSSRFSALLDGARKARRMFVSNLDTTLRKDVDAFGPQGQEIADLLKRSEQIGDKLEGDRAAFYWNTIRPLLTTPAERINFTEVAGGEAVRALSPNVEKAVKLYREFDTNVVFRDAGDIGLRELVPKTHSLGQGELFPEVAQRARDLAKSEPAEWIKVPVQFRQNHVPHFYKKDAVAKLRVKGSMERKATAEQLFENGMATSKEHGEQLLDDMLHAEDGYFTPLEFRGGPLQFSRELLLGIPWEKDPDKWFPRYAHISSKRIAQGATFGPQDEKLLEWIDTLKRGAGDSSRAEDIYRLIIGRPTRRQSLFREAQSTIGAAQTIVGLGPKTAMLQFMQLANSVGAFGFTNTFRGLGAMLFNPETRALAREVGALLPSSNMSFDADGATSWSSWWLHNVTQMPAADRGVRVSSGAAAMLAARQWAEALPSATPGRIAEAAERNLRRLGIDPSVIVGQGGQLTVEQMRSAFLNGANFTQFATHLSDMPEIWRTPIGRFMFKFRSFGKQQTRFVGTLVDEARRGNPKPLMRYLAAYPAVYTAARPSLDFLAGRHKPDEEEAAAEYLKGVLYAGALGGLGDFFTNATANDPSRVFGMLLGPAATQAAGTITDVAAALGGEPGRLQRTLRRTVQTPVLRPLELLNE